MRREHGQVSAELSLANGGMGIMPISIQHTVGKIM